MQQVFFWILLPGSSIGDDCRKLQIRSKEIYQKPDILHIISATWS